VPHKNKQKMGRRREENSTYLGMKVLVAPVQKPWRNEHNHTLLVTTITVNKS